MSELPRPIEEEEEDTERSERMSNLGSTPRSAGAAIAPPPSLQESSPAPESPSGPKPVPSFGGSSVAAKIMAKFGYKVCSWWKSLQLLGSLQKYTVLPCQQFTGRSGSG